MPEINSRRPRIVTAIGALVSVVLMGATVVTGLARNAWSDSFWATASRSALTNLDLFTRPHWYHPRLGAVLTGLAVAWLLGSVGSRIGSRATSTSVSEQLNRSIRLVWYFLMGVTTLTGFAINSDWSDSMSAVIVLAEAHRFAAVALVATSVLLLIGLIRRKRCRFTKQVVRVAGVAVAIGGATCWLLVRGLNQPIVYECAARQNVVELDGVVDELEWLGVPSVTLNASGGAGFHQGVSRVTFRAFHRKGYVFAAISWTDPSESLNRLLEKTDEQTWAALKTVPEPEFGEEEYWEDQLVVMWSSAGGCSKSCHLTGDGNNSPGHSVTVDTLDSWHWRSAATNPARQADDGWWGPAADESGSIHFDPKAGGGHISNLNTDWNQPYLLPAHSLFSRSIVVESETVVPYFTEFDTFPIGTRIPALVVARLHGDRSDVRAYGRHRGGVWTVEFSRRLSTGSPLDLEFGKKYQIDLAIFDNAENRHSIVEQSLRVVAR